MPPRILIAYATKHETTREIAEFIAGTLEEEGVETEARPVDAVESLAGFDMVVIGSPIYMGKILKEAKTFVARFADDLQKRQVEAFAVGMSCKDLTEENRRKVQEAMAPITDRVQVRGELGMFAGRMNPSFVPVLGRFMKYDEAKTEDARDWEAVRGWARVLAERCAVAAV
ncbi:menaquinone-dependent protoporphyrinogen oxidase [Methanofollis sp. W23]|uniref:flavodoxin domain-containing protein n=1 Tax=Methanofollis sp. W23 TaxID=2817849 RepID=UPI001AE65E25|nr:flavodoxin domain-containing protein [Methanofollis sp. W23]MBP2145245.1 menaquinone-dependent protoporphyrinogen oxidase [Methanofollis sp. W23]